VLKGMAAKTLVGAVLAAVGTTGTILAVHDLRLHPTAPRGPVSTSTSVAGARLVRPASRDALVPRRPGVAVVQTPSALLATGRAGLARQGLQELPAIHALGRGRTAQLNTLLAQALPRAEILAGGGGTALGAIEVQGGPPRLLVAPVPPAPALTSSPPALPSAGGEPGSTPGLDAGAAAPVAPSPLRESPASGVVVPAPAVRHGPRDRSESPEGSAPASGRGNGQGARDGQGPASGSGPGDGHGATGPSNAGAPSSGAVPSGPPLGPGSGSGSAPGDGTGPSASNGPGSGSGSSSAPRSDSPGPTIPVAGGPPSTGRASWSRPGHSARSGPVPGAAGPLLPTRGGRGWAGHSQGHSR
jgi:hypothetical protein